ncbi:MAG: hypothetical protein AABZ39_20915 [Spirochaetota bacterium]
MHHLATAAVLLCVSFVLLPYRSSVLLDEADTIVSWTGAESDTAPQSLIDSVR